MKDEAVRKAEEKLKEIESMSGQKKELEAELEELQQKRGELEGKMSEELKEQ